MAEGRGPRQALVAEDAAAYARSAGAAPCLSRCADHLHAPRSGGSGRQQLLARLEPDVPAERLCRPAVDRPRPEERRVGKECVSTGRARWSPYHSKKKTN